MAWIKDCISTLKEAVGTSRYAIDGIVALVLGALDLAARQWAWWPLSTIPHWVVWLVLVEGLLVWWLLNYANSLRTQIKMTRVGLSELRREGVALRNNGQAPIIERGAWETWRDAITEWNDRVVAKIKEASEADAEWFATLDVVPPPRLPPYIGKSNGEPWEHDRCRLFGWHDFRLQRLDQIIQQGRK